MIWMLASKIYYALQDFFGEEWRNKVSQDIKNFERRIKLCQQEKILEHSHFFFHSRF